MTSKTRTLPVRIFETVLDDRSTDDAEMNIRRHRRPSLASLIIVLILCGSGFGIRAARSAPPDDQNGPPPDGPPPNGPPGIDRAIDQLQLSDDQKQKVDPIVQEFQQQQEQARSEFLSKMKTVLSAEQYDQLQSEIMRPPPPPPPPPPRDSSDQPNVPATQPSGAATVDPLKVPVTISGGHDTDPRDRGRPVVLVAAGLNVPCDVFRKAFSKVKPAPAGQEPDPAQVRLNKQALLGDLAPYDVTNDRLDEVSNYYRYVRSRGERWRTTPATAYATVEDGVVKSITITNHGSGYSSVPTITVPGAQKQTFTAILLFSTDLSKNGSIQKISIGVSETTSNPWPAP
jgi:hypothetical protein